MLYCFPGLAYWYVPCWERITDKSTSETTCSPGACHQFLAILSIKVISSRTSVAMETRDQCVYTNVSPQEQTEPGELSLSLYCRSRVFLNTRPCSCLHSFTLPKFSCPRMQEYPELFLNTWHELNKRLMQIWMSQVLKFQRNETTKWAMCSGGDT